MHFISLAPAYGLRAQSDFGVLFLQFLHELPFSENFLVGIPHHRELFFNLYELSGLLFGVFHLFKGHRGAAIFGEGGGHTFPIKLNYLLGLSLDFLLCLICAKVCRRGLDEYFT